MIKNKKGIQLNEAFVSVLTLVLVAVLVIVALYLLGALGNSMQVQNTAGTSVNESILKSAMPHGLDARAREDGVCGAITAVYNGTGGALLGLGNFSQGSFLGNDNCVLYNESVMTTWASTILVTYPYTYTAETAASNATNDTVDQFTSYPALIGLIGTIIFLGIVIGVLVASFMPKNSP